MHRSAEDPRGRELATRHTWRAVFVVTSLFGTWLASSGAFAHATPGASDGALVLVLDASGSMRAKVGAKRKINIARDVIDGLVDDLPAGTQTSLLAYGHRDRTRCDDIELLVPLSPIDKQAFKRRVDGVEPKGKTPLTAAAMTAIEMADKHKRHTTVVLVSDGLETCNASPCDMVKAAKARGVDFVLHVVGFDLKGQDTAALKCAAEASGGRYLEADDAEQLKRALDLATEEIKPAAGTVVVSVTKNGAPLKSTISIANKGGRKYWNNAIGSDATFLAVPEGAYEIEVRPINTAATIAHQTVAVALAAGQTREVSVRYDTGTVQLNVKHNGEPVAPNYMEGGLVESNAKSSWGHLLQHNQTRPGTYEFDLPPGKYWAMTSYDPVTSDRSQKVTFEVLPGKQTVVTQEYQSGVIRFELFADGKPLDPGPYLMRVGRDDGWTKTITPNAIRLAPGRYTFSWPGAARFSMDLNAAETITKALQCTSAHPMTKCSPAK